MIALAIKDYRRTIKAGTTKCSMRHERDQIIDQESAEWFLFHSKGMWNFWCRAAGYDPAEYREAVRRKYAKA